MKTVSGFGPAIIVAAIALMSAGCATRPVAELGDARAAMNAAKDACVDYYLPKDYEEIGQMVEEAEKRDEDAANSVFVGYKKARITAINSKKKADSSTAKATDLLHRAKNDAERSIKEAMYAIESAEKSGAREYVPVKFEAAQSYLVEAKNTFFVSTCGYSAAIEKAKLSQIMADESVRLTKVERDRLAKLEADRLGREEMERLARERATLETRTKTPVAPLPQPNPATSPVPSKKDNSKVAPVPSPKTTDQAAPAAASSVLSEYAVGKGETLWQIAGKKEIYGDPYLWPILYKANRAQIKDPTQISEGQRLAVPRNVSQKELEEAAAEAKEKGLWGDAPEDKDKGPKEHKKPLPDR